ncbi:peptidoglycan-associated lipoprotein Pal [Pseudophaeobacter sp.]|jgi:peptidoglycan-associated lipoprotein|uniref:Peptidoglycan-associated lipoprotein n=1 Tax=Pseudophaeobacter arcticus TaxID=385492 RepID=A0ABQ0AJL7_9RHOB|nr:peptidoglycan-associated lipoprotein Pal [Pseudophaeobacter sp.]MDF1729436.1 peptidoglycan-associated lipoprotein Pal [Sulfitobacter sp.]UWS80695.1 peptidoglycan-associated lipoprotein Pal [Phaeobacter sp. G2]
MSGFKKAFVLVAALGLSACSNTSWDDTGAGGAGGPGGIGSNLDPASPAYFQETIGDRVLFLVDQSSLNPTAEAILQGQARWLTANPDYTVTIQGHADEQGTRIYNLALGERRANSAREYLISQGIAGSRIQVVSYGKERPLEICSAESCYAKNRRAVTVLAGGLTG